MLHGQRGQCRWIGRPRWWSLFLRRETGSCFPIGGSHSSASLARSIQGYSASAVIPEEQCDFPPGRGTVEQLYILNRVLEGEWEFVETVHMCFVDLEKVFDLGESWGDSLRLWSVGAPLCRLSASCMTGVRAWSTLPAVSWTHFLWWLGCAFSPILFINFMERISWCSHSVEGVQFGDVRLGSLLFADDVVLLAPLVCDFQLSLHRFSVWSGRDENQHLQIWGHVSWPKKNVAPCREGHPAPRGGVEVPRGKMEWELDRWGAASAVIRTLHRSVMVKRKLKLSIYGSIYVPSLTYGHKLWLVTKRTTSQVQAPEMSFIHRVAGLSLTDALPLGGSSD